MGDAGDRGGDDETTLGNRTTIEGRITSVSRDLLHVTQQLKRYEHDHDRIITLEGQVTRLVDLATKAGDRTWQVLFWIATTVATVLGTLLLGKQVLHG